MTKEVTNAISFRVTPEQYALWKALANDAGLTEGTYAKKLAVEHIRAKQGELLARVTGNAPVVEAKPVASMEELVDIHVSDEAKGKVSELDQEEAEDMEDLFGDDKVEDEDEGVMFVEDPYIGEKDSADFKELRRETNREG